MRCSRPYVSLVTGTVIAILLPSELLVTGTVIVTCDPALLLPLM
jgi:hypothetical protein